jgi:restriction system protein
MGRNRGFTGVLIQLRREAELRARQEAAAQRRAAQEAQRAQRAFARAVAADEKERKRLYEVARVAEVASLNEQLVLDVEDLQMPTVSPVRRRRLDLSWKPPCRRPGGRLVGHRPG